MSAWMQAGIALTVAILAYLWLRALKATERTNVEGHNKGLGITFFIVIAVVLAYALTSVKAVIVYAVTGSLVLLAVLVRLIFVPKLALKPTYAQGQLEVIVRFAQAVSRFFHKLIHKQWIPKSIAVASIFVMFGRIIAALYGSEGEEFAVEIFPSNMTIFGVQLSSSIFYVWTIIGVVAVLAIVFRLFVVPRFTDSPKGIQNLLEISIDGIDQYTHGKLHCSTQALACYFFSLVVLMVSSAALELLGVRPPTADLVMTFSMATITFCMINYYGIKEKGVKGRIKSLASPSAIIMPIRILTDVAIPVSLACRLFGNMLGGMIVMDLLKIALGPNGIGLPPVAGLYFNVFHPLIQTYIFVTLSLTFINEAVE